jgi:hypothetical protein
LRRSRFICATPAAGRTPSPRSSRLPKVRLLLTN